MSSTAPGLRIAILGGGPAGVGAAYRLHQQQAAQALLFEQGGTFGGNAGSITWQGQRLDFGSHRLHPSCEPEILADIRRLLGEDLIDRPRHGRIRLLGKWIHFPLKPLDLLLRLDRSFAAGTLRDLLGKALPNGRATEDTFEGVLRDNLGATICRHFYFPYARKIWGRDPAALSGIQARRRVAAGSFRKLLRKVLSQVPGLKTPGAGRFFYPANNFGQISEAFAAEAVRLGAELRTGTRVTRLVAPSGGAESWRVLSVSGGAGEREDRVDWVWSTLPLPAVAAMMEPRVPAEVEQAARVLTYRSMLLIYLRLPVDQFTPYDAHYFPEESTAITRLSEPKNYHGRGHPRGSTVLCGELPCAVGDGHWNASDEELGKLLERDLEAAGLPLPAPPTHVTVRRLSHAYPIYLNGYENHFDLLDRWAEETPRLLTYGRQGLFAHDNTHHALAMAYAAVACLENDRFREDRWREARLAFRSHVVED